jgi:hypothetical protein
VSALAIESYRPATVVPGGPDLPGWLHVNDGTHATGASVLVSHSSTAFAALVADAIAEVLPNATLVIARAKQAQAEAEQRTGRAHAAELDAKANLDAVLHGRRRLFGEALVRVAEDCSAWLLDPVKREAGFGLRYPSLADLWRAHPELRPVRWDGGDLIVDATIALAETLPRQKAGAA